MIMGIASEPLVSSDIIKTSLPAIVDITFTKVVDGNLVKVLVWYDNEWAYTSTLIMQLNKIN